MIDFPSWVFKGRVCDGMLNKILKLSEKYLYAHVIKENKNQAVIKGKFDELGKLEIKITNKKSRYEGIITFAEFNAYDGSLIKKLTKVFFLFLYVVIFLWTPFSFIPVMIILLFLFWWLFEFPNKLLEDIFYRLYFLTMPVRKKELLIRFNKFFGQLTNLIKPDYARNIAPSGYFLAKYGNIIYILADNYGLVTHYIKGLKELNECRHLINEWKNAAKLYYQKEEVYFEEYYNDMDVRDHINKLINKLKREKEITEGKYKEIYKEMMAELKEADKLFKKATLPSNHKGSKWWRKRTLKYDLK